MAQIYITKHKVRKHTKAHRQNANKCQNNYKITFICASYIIISILPRKLKSCNIRYQCLCCTGFMSFSWKSSQFILNFGSKWSAWMALPEKQSRLSGFSLSEYLFTPFIQLYLNGQCWPQNVKIWENDAFCGYPFFLGKIRKIQRNFKI